MTSALLATVLLVVLGASGRHAGRLRRRARHVSHEVRGPLTAASLLLHGAVRRGEVAPGLVAQLDLELRRAALAVDDPDGPGTPQTVDLGALLRRQMGAWEELAAEHGARVVLVPGPAPVMVRGDALRVAQATANVVANAIEHGGGLVEIRVRALGGHVRVEVRDDGPGLPGRRLLGVPGRPGVSVLPGRRARRRGGRPGARGHGLAIAARIAARSGGRLARLPSRRGGRVAIDLPRASAEAAT